MTIPEVFIIESLKLEDEEKDRYEGKIISNILELNGKNSKYYYIRTRREFEEIVDIFYKSEYRYLHLSCHGNDAEMATSLDLIPFKDLGRMLHPCLKDRRLFISACEMVNTKLAKNIIPQSGCYSIIGPSKEVAFSDAAILWASFYHLMFNHNYDGMKREELLKYCKRISDLYRVPLNYYGISQSNKRGFRVNKIKPRP